MLFSLALLGLAGGAALFRSHASRSEPPIAAITAEPRAPRAGEAHSAGRVVVYVAGEVARPGVYELPPGSRAEAAILAAGGVRASADPIAVNLAQRLEDGEELAVPARGSAGVSRQSSAGQRTSGRGRHRRLRGSSGARQRSHKAPDEPVDLNSADAATLETLPGVGPALAERIVEFRDANGPFASLDDLLDVAGTSPRLIEALQPYALTGR